MVKFYTTEAFLSDIQNIFLEEKIAISSLTLMNIPSDIVVDKNKVDIFEYQPYMLKWAKERNIQITDEIKELTAAIEYDRQVHPDDTIFISNNSYLRDIANLYFGEDSIDSIVK